jgi:hypothetical protein
VVWVACEEGRFLTFIYFSGDELPELVNVPKHNLQPLLLPLKSIDL